MNKKTPAAKKSIVNEKPKSRLQPQAVSSKEKLTSAKNHQKTLEDAPAVDEEQAP